jgi:transposase
VKREPIDWLADNPFYTRRFAFFVGRRCRETTVKEVADDLFLDWHTVKDLDKQYMREQLRRAGNPAPRVIGIDEIAIAKGHQYRIVVSDLERGRPIWFGGKDRSEASMDAFFAWLGPKKCGKIRLAVMDMWQAFRTSTLKKGNAPQATILYDKFHIVKHLGEAMDKVRKREYARLSGKDRRFIKGQRYTLLSHWGNLTAEGRAALKLLFKANKRLNTAYLLKESFGRFTLRGHCGRVAAIAFSPDWRRIASGAIDPANGDTEVRIWDTASGKGLSTLTCRGGICGLAFRSDGHQLIGVRAMSSETERGTFVWDGTPRTE